MNCKHCERLEQLEKEGVLVNERRPMSTAYGEALAAARELSNPEGRRGYKRTSALAAMVAAQIANELQPIVSALDTFRDELEFSASGPDAEAATKRIEVLCRALVGGQ